MADAHALTILSGSQRVDIMIDDTNGSKSPDYDGYSPKEPPPLPPATFPGVDIYTNWALGPGREDFFASKDQRKWVPVLFELADISAENFARGLYNADIPLIGAARPGQEPWTEEERLRQQERWRNIVRVTGLYLRSIPEPGEHVEPPPGNVYLSALVNVAPEGLLEADFFALLNSEDGNEKLKEAFVRCTIGTPLDARALRPFASEPIEAVPWPEPDPNLAPEEGTVVVGIIDDGIAFAHERFRNAPAETRVEYLWLQGEYFDHSTMSPEFTNGREVKKHDTGAIPGIDTLLSNATHAGLVDEHAVYRSVGMEDFGRVRTIDRKGHKSTAQRASHGAHVMDVAAGHPMAEARDDRPIIAVQLPTEVTAATSGKHLEPYLIDAVHYILRRADQIAVDRNCGQLPVVINFSFGHSRGPHDGTTPSERVLDQVIQLRSAPLRIVLPSGNTHLSRTHAQISFEDATAYFATHGVHETKTLRWRVLPDDETASFLDIWLPRGTPDERVEVVVERRRAGGPEVLGRMSEISKTVFDSGVLASGPLTLTIDAGGDAKDIGTIYYKHESESDRGHFSIELAPTERTDPSGELVAPPGMYKVSLINKKLDSDDLIHLWIQRDDTPFGFPRYGRQSYFDDPNYERFELGGRPEEQDSVDSPVKRAGTLSGLATGDRTVVIGGVYRHDLSMAEYSAGGPTYDADRVGPDASAVSDDTRVHQGILAAGTRSGSTVAISGTSVAAPQITRWIADELAGGDPGDRTAVKNRAIIEESGSPPRPPRPSHERGGNGRIIRPPAVDLDRYEP